jgi:histidine triad (HIT) family protein
VENDCVFCKIAAGEIPAKVAYRDDDFVAIEDLNPQAPTHLLVLPVAHHRDFGNLVDAEDARLTHGLLRVAVELGRRAGGENGFRLVANTGRDGGQTVDHLHLHVLAGRPMRWPPG